MSATLTPDLTLTRAYLEELTGQKNPEVTFQTFSDVKDPKAERDPLARVLHGTLDRHTAELARLNEKGAGVFVMVNEGDGRGREAGNVTRIRAFFTDQDGPQKQEFARPPSFTVKTSPGRYQAFWRVAGDVPLGDFTSTQKRLVAFYGADPAVTDLPRVMRLPGFYHRKKEPCLVTFEPGSGWTYTLDEIRAAHPEEAKPPTSTPQKTTPPGPAAGSRREKLLQIVREKAEGRSWTEGNRHASAKSTAAHGRKLGLEARDLAVIVTDFLLAAGKTEREAEDIVAWTLKNVTPDPDELAERPAPTKAAASVAPDPEEPGAAAPAEVTPAKHKVTVPENAAALLRDVRAFISRYVVLMPEQEVTVTLWALHTWAIVAADMSPYLAVNSAVMRTGKTRLLETVELVVRNPWRVVQPSEAVLFRKLGQGDATLLFDEVDTVFGKNVSDAQEGIRAVLNCGFQRGATIPRCIDRGQKIEEFHVFGPKLLAGIGLPPPTVRDRSFVIGMRRKKRTESVSRFRRRDAEALAAPLRERLERWAESAVDGLRDARPALPEKLGDRAQDAAEPLLAIADAAGAEWPDLARKALVVLAGEDDGDDDELGVRLLADCRVVFGLLQKTDGEITTAALLVELHAREESPWKKLHKGEPLDPNGLARLLRPFGVRPRVIRQAEGTVRGYLVSAFSDPFERYLPLGTPGETPETVKQSNDDAGENVSGGVKHDPKQGAAVLPLFGAAGSVSPPVSPQGETVSINEDGPCFTVSGVAGRVADTSARRRRTGL